MAFSLGSLSALPVIILFLTVCRDRPKPSSLIPSMLKCSICLPVQPLSPSADSCELTLDTNTMDQQLYLSEGNRRVTCVFTEDDYPSHSERFANVEQVLATDGF